MSSKNIFISVGPQNTDNQKKFLANLKERLKAEGFDFKIIGENTFGAEPPWKTITDSIDNCSGVVVVALEKTYVKLGSENRGGDNEIPLNDVRIPTPWNQIETGLAYFKGLPILMIMEEGIKSEGLLSTGYDWYAMKCELSDSVFASVKFNNVFTSWKLKVEQGSQKSKKPHGFNPGEMTIGELINALKASHLYSTLSAIVALTIGSFLFGQFLSKNGFSLRFPRDRSLKEVRDSIRRANRDIRIPANAYIKSTSTVISGGVWGDDLIQSSKNAPGDTVEYSFASSDTIYNLSIKYASMDSRPVRIFLDDNEIQERKLYCEQPTEGNGRNNVREYVVANNIRMNKGSHLMKIVSAGNEAQNHIPHFQEIIFYKVD